MPGTIDRVTPIKQGELTIYSFPLTAKKLRELGVISRLHEQEGGIQRKLDEVKGGEIALAMVDPTVQWLDAIIVHLEPLGSWCYERGSINYSDDFRLSVDDGQHRRYALDGLNDQELERLGEFSVTAAFALTFKQRFELFLQQEKRRHIDRNLQLEGRYLIDKWDAPSDKTAYGIVRALALNERSPLFDKVELEEVERRQIGVVHPKLLAIGLNRSVKSAISNKSLLYGMDAKKQEDIMVRYLRIASEIWSDKWGKPSEYIISSARGVNSLLRLFVSSATFRLMLTHNDFSDVRLRSVLLLASAFDWSVATNKNRSDRDLIVRLDDMMSRKYKIRENNREHQRNSR